MSLPRIVGFSGNTQRPSKTRALVAAIAEELAQKAQVEIQLFDLVDAGVGLGSALSRDSLSLPARRVIEAIETADGLIVASPVYKGAYTGLFKHLFDLVDPAALTNTPVILGATGGGPRHALVVEHALRPLFGFFEALALPTAVYGADADFHDGALIGEVARQRASAAAGQLVAALGASAKASRPLDDLRAAGVAR